MKRHPFVTRDRQFLAITGRLRWWYAERCYLARRAWRVWTGEETAIAPGRLTALVDASAALDRIRIETAKSECDGYWPGGVHESEQEQYWADRPVDG